MDMKYIIDDYSTTKEDVAIRIANMLNRMYGKQYSVIFNDKAIYTTK